MCRNLCIMRNIDIIRFRRTPTQLDMISLYRSSAAAVTDCSRYSRSVHEYHVPQISCFRQPSFPCPPHLSHRPRLFLLLRPRAQTTGYVTAQRLGFTCFLTSCSSTLTNCTHISTQCCEKVTTEHTTYLSVPRLGILVSRQACTT